MDIQLTDVEARVLGVLMEKEMTTPEYYPLSLNALVNACNQKSNRDPVMNLSDKEVLTALDQLRNKKLAWHLSTAGGRVPKYEHNIRSIFSFSKQETAVIDVLLLRGAQTTGELRVRTERMYSFSSLDDIVETLQKLATREDGPFVIELPRQPGHKEHRYMHLFGGMPDLEKYADEKRETAPQNLSAEDDRISILEMELKQLRLDFNKLKDAFIEFKRQLE